MLCAVFPVCKLAEWQMINEDVSTCVRLYYADYDNVNIFCVQHINPVAA